MLPRNAERVLEEMAKQAKLPIEGKAIRFAPGRNDKPLTALWKVWAEGNEVYATSRFTGQSIHISVHESGQVHCRLATKQKQDFSPLGPRESLKNKLGHLIPTPEGLVLHANLIIGASGTPLYSPLPVELTSQ